MQEENARAPQEGIAAGTIRHSWSMPAFVFILGVLSIGMLIWSIRMNQDHRTNFSRANSMMDLQIIGASFHLWFEEYITGDPNVMIESVWATLEEGIALSETILNGGAGEHDLVLLPIRDPEFRKEIEGLQSLLGQIKTVALQRFQNPLTSRTGTDLDEQFDELFKKFMMKARGLEDEVEGEQVRNQIRSERMFLFMLFVWTFIVISATAGLWSRENRRIASERALQAQTDELQNHRLRLQELVNERTAELVTANRDLQSEIAGHKQTLVELEENKNRFEKLSLEFHALLDAIPDSLTLLSPELKVLWANIGAASLLGKEVSGGTAGMCCYHLRGARSAPCKGCPVLQAFDTQKTENAQISAEDGIIWDVRAFPIKDTAGTVTNVIEVATDITEKLALQAESMRMTHLASLGELAAGVAHEINNPINGIINYAQVMLDESGGVNGEQEIPSLIIKEGNRIATIVRSLLSFARENKKEKMPVHIHGILSNTLALCGRQLERDGITLRADVPEELPRIAANPQQIEQVLLNVINNARYALNLKYPEADDGKILDISCEQVVVDQRPHLKLTVCDKGIGIPADIINKLVDPFFSTKPQGEGAGLGLSISHGIVSDHGGRLIIQSTEGMYTRVHVILPEVPERC